MRFAMALRLFAAFLLPIALVLSHRNAPAVLAFVGLSGIFALRGMRFPAWSLWAMGFVLYAALTALWSPYDHAYVWPPYLVLLVLCFAGAARAQDVISDRALLIAATVSILLLGIEAITGGLIRDLVPPDHRSDKDDVATARGIAVAMSLAPAVLLVFYRQRRWALFALTAASITYAATQFDITANLMAMLAGVMAGGFAYLYPRLGLKLIFAAIGLGALVMPLTVSLLPPVEVLLGLEEGPVSWRQRLVIWQAVWTASLADGVWPFLFGHGVEAARPLGEGLGLIQLSGMTAPLHMVPNHPHNIYLQIWYEMGLLGVLLFLMALWAGAQTVLRQVTAPDMAAAIAALAASVLVLALVDASLWTLWRVVGPLMGGLGLFYVTKRIKALP